MNKIFKKRKPKKILIKNISLSLPFVVRDVCKFCGTLPCKYHRLSSKPSYKEVNDFKKDSIFVETYFRVNEKVYNRVYLNMVNDFKLLKYSITDKSYNTRYHKILDKQLQKDEFDPLEFLICKCEKTEWCFTRISAQSREEIKSKRAEKTFPFKYEY